MTWPQVYWLGVASFMLWGLWSLRSFKVSVHGHFFDLRYGLVALLGLFWPLSVPYFIAMRVAQLIFGRERVLNWYADRMERRTGERPTFRRGEPDDDTTK
jgi:hypothetical protein